MKYALVDTTTNEVVNVIVVDNLADYEVPEGFTLDPSRDLAPAVTPDLPKPPAFLARDLFALLTVDDFIAIQGAIVTRPGLGLLWASLQAQGSAPIETSSARFQTGWAALMETLGFARSQELATSLGIV